MKDDSFYEISVLFTLIFDLLTLLDHKHYKLVSKTSEFEPSEVMYRTDRLYSKWTDTCIHIGEFSAIYHDYIKPKYMLYTRAA